MLESLSLQVLHGEERRTIVLSDFINHTDAGMIQRGCGSHLALKALQRLRIAGQFLGQKLQRDMAAQLGVLGLVHHAHSAAAQFAAESCSERWSDRSSLSPPVRWTMLTGKRPKA